jgi:hypothetical protein
VTDFAAATLRSLSPEKINQSRYTRDGGRISMFAHETIHVRIYQVLDVVLASRGVPPGAKGAMFSIIDQMRASSPRFADTLRAEQISVKIHELEVALRAHDETALQTARDALKSLAVEWPNASFSGREASALTV